MKHIGFLRMAEIVSSTSCGTGGAPQIEAGGLGATALQGWRPVWDKQDGKPEVNEPLADVRFIDTPTHCLVTATSY